MNILLIPYSTIPSMEDLRLAPAVLLVAPESFGIEARLATDNILSRVAVTDTSLNVPEKLKQVTYFLNGDKPYIFRMFVFRVDTSKHIVWTMRDGVVYIDVPPTVGRHEFSTAAQELEIFKVVDMVHRGATKFGTVKFAKLMPDTVQRFNPEDTESLHQAIDTVCNVVNVRPYAWATFLVLTEKKQPEKAQAVFCDARRTLAIPSFGNLEEVWVYYANHTALIVFLYSSLDPGQVKIVNAEVLDKVRKGQDPDTAQKLRKVLEYKYYGGPAKR